MKKLLLALLAICSVANGSALQCPAIVQCAYQSGHTVCSNLPQSWEIYQGLTPTVTLLQDYAVSGVSWASVGVAFRNVECKYISITNSFNKLSIERAAEQTILNPDMLDLWGWSWVRTDRSAATCASPSACKFAE